MIWAFLILLLGLSVSANTSEKFIGQLTLWNRGLCIEIKNCPLPKPMGPQWKAEWEIEKPRIAGSSTFRSQAFNKDQWTLHISMYWLLPHSGREKDYFVTQLRLLHKTQGLVFECSRYDFIENIKGFPTGSCSGRFGNEQIGIAYKRNP